jgi:DNA-directed RNA polymerase subunit RPC12/RpoP
MKEYQDALKDMQFKKNISENKTKNHIRGHAYSSITLKNIYVGEIYKWIEKTKENGCYHCQYKLLNKPKKMYMFIHDSYFDDDTNYKTISDFLIDIVKTKTNSRGYESNYGYTLFEYNVAKLPERVDGGLVLIDDFNETLLQQSIKEYNKKIFAKEMQERPYDVKESLFYSASKDVKPNISQEYVDRFKPNAYNVKDEIIYDISWFKGKDNN